MESLLVVCALAAAAFFLGWKIRVILRNKKNISCGCSCSDCSSSPTCPPPKTEHPEQKSSS